MSLSVADDPHDHCRNSTVRIRNGTSMGSGTVFRENANAYYVLTNAHVAGTRLGNRVELEFWQKGHQSKPVTGETVAVAYVPRASRDIAVVRVQKEVLGRYRPPVVPLAAAGERVDSRQVFSVGCASGRWPSAFEGFVIRRSSRSDRLIHFVPMPAGGRSGSALFDLTLPQPRIIGLIAWRSSDEGGHGLDGRDESHGYGIAMTHHEVHAALSGQASSAQRGNATPLIPLAWITKEEDEVQPSRSSDDEVVLLKFSDPDAVEGGPLPSSSEGSQTKNLNSPPSNPTDSCPGGSCPLPQRTPLFPSLPSEGLSEGEGNGQEPWKERHLSWRLIVANPLRFLPWIVAIAFIVFWSLRYTQTRLRADLRRWVMEDKPTVRRRGSSTAKRPRKSAMTSKR